MDQNMAFVGAMCIGLALIVGFFVFAYKIGATSAFGRYALSWRKLGILTLAACIPGLGLSSVLILCTFPPMLEQPTTLACAMAFVGWSCFSALSPLEAWARIEPQSLQKRLGAAPRRRGDLED